MQFSQEAIDLVKEYEGFRAKPYKCLAGQNTIGYGHRLSHSIKPCMRITEEEALTLLRHDLIAFSSYINQKVKVALNQCQYDALCSLVYNWGCFKFGKSNGLTLLNQRKFDMAADEFFSKEKGVVNIKGIFCNGLYRRRQAELKLWNRK